MEDDHLAQISDQTNKQIYTVRIFCQSLHCGIYNTGVVGEESGSTLTQVIVKRAHFRKSCQKHWELLIMEDGNNAQTSDQTNKQIYTVKNILAKV